MKRNLFLLGVGAIAATGCSHHGGSSFLPRSAGGGGLPSSGDLAAAFPASPLPSPSIIGEVRRFDGAVTPAGWMICDGSAIPVLENPHLAEIIGRSTGGDGTISINLPRASAFPKVIATAGLVPRTPTELAAIFERRAKALPETKGA